MKKPPSLHTRLLRRERDRLRKQRVRAVLYRAGLGSNGLPRVNRGAYASPGAHPHGCLCFDCLYPAEREERTVVACRVLMG